MTQSDVVTVLCLVSLKVLGSNLAFLRSTSRVSSLRHFVDLNEALAFSVHSRCMPIGLQNTYGIVRSLHPPPASPERPASRAGSRNAARFRERSCGAGG
jgi:hypothetical protein